MIRWVKLSEYAKMLGLKYQAVWLKYKRGQIKNTKFDNNRVYVCIDEDEIFPIKGGNKVAIYARVSDNASKDNLNRQVKRLTEYATMRGYKIVKVVKEIGSGVNDHRPKLEKLLNEYKDYSILLVEHKDRLTRFGFNYIELMMKALGKNVEVVNLSDENSNLIEDMISIVYSFSARLYGARRAKQIKDITNKAIKDESSNG